MSEDEDPDPATIVDSDAVDVDIADDPDESRLIVTGLTVSASEKVSTGDYENYEPFQQVRASISPPVDASTVAGRLRVRRMAMTLHRDVQADIQRAIDARLSSPDFEDWPDGVEPADPDGDR